MTSYAGLDVSQQETTVCVVDAAGVVRFVGSCATERGAIAVMLGAVAPGLARAVLETGALTPWLFHGLTALGVPVVCTCARQAHAASSHGPSKTDPKPSQVGCRRAGTAGADCPPMAAAIGPFGDGGAACWRAWLKPVNVRSLATHERKTALVAREALVRTKNRLTNQVRGLLKPFGLLVGKVGAGRLELRVCELRVRDLAAEWPELMLSLEPLLAVRRRTMDEIEALDRQLVQRSRGDAVVHRLMTIPLRGLLTAFPAGIG